MYLLLYRINTTQTNFQHESRRNIGIVSVSTSSKTTLQFLQTLETLEMNKIIKPFKLNIVTFARYLMSIWIKIILNSEQKLNSVNLYNLIK